MHSKIKSDIANLLISKGFERGCRDTYVKLVEGKNVRYKIQDISLRKEIQIIHEATQYSPQTKSWVGVWSAYLKDVEVGEKIVVKKRM